MTLWTTHLIYTHCANFRNLFLCVESISLMFSVSKQKRMKTITVKPSDYTGVKKQRLNTRKISPRVFHVTGSDAKTLPDPEVVDYPNNALNRKKTNLDDDNIRVLWSEFRDNTSMHGLKNANLQQRRKLRW